MIRTAVAYVLYAIGHVISRPMVRFDRCAWIYPAYNWLMLASSAVQGNRRAPWVDAANG